MPVHVGERSQHRGFLSFQCNQLQLVGAQHTVVHRHDSAGTGRGKRGEIGHDIGEPAYFSIVYAYGEHGCDTILGSYEINVFAVRRP